MVGQHCSNFAHIAQENFWDNIEQKDKIVRNGAYPNFLQRDNIQHFPPGY